MASWQHHLLVVIICASIGLKCANAQKIFNVLLPIQLPKEIRSTVGNDPPVYLSTPISHHPWSDCGALIYRRYFGFIFEGFVNFAKILTAEREGGYIMFTISMLGILRECLERDELKQRITIHISYDDAYVSHTYFALHWVNNHTLSSANQTLRLSKYGNYFEVCNVMPKDAMRRIYVAPMDNLEVGLYVLRSFGGQPRSNSFARTLHTIADDPPIFIAEPHVMMKPNEHDTNNTSLYDKIFIEAYVNTAKLPYNTRTFESSIILTCKVNATVRDLCTIKYDGAHRNSSWVKGDNLHDAHCGVESLENLKLRVFYEMSYKPDLLPCLFSVHLVSYYGISTHYKTLNPPAFSSRYNMPSPN